MCHFTVRVPVLSISSCVCFYGSVPGLSMNICVSVSFYSSCSSSQPGFLCLFYVSVPGLSMNLCVSVSFYCSCSSSQHQFLCLFLYLCSRIKYEYLCECVILLFVFQFLASVPVFVFMLVFQD